MTNSSVNRLIYFTLLYFILVHKKAMSKQCEGFFDNGVEDETDSEMRRLTCPEQGQPAHFTECCASVELRCCPGATFLQQMDAELVMTVALVVITCCVLLIVLVLICCFSSRCPLYNVCRVNYTQGGVIAYSKEEDPLTGNMPQDWSGQNCYEPNAIKIKPVEDV